MRCGGSAAGRVAGWGERVNYFEHHIGDYDADTSHLTWAEDMAYTRLLRLYYRREKPIPADVNDAARLVRAVSKAEKQAVAAVLSEFFVLGEDGWHQSRADAELERYRRKVEHNREVGKLGGRPKKTETQPKPIGLVVGSIREPEQNPLQTPDTNTTPPIPPKGGRTPAICLSAWLDSVKASGQKPIPEDDAVFTYAEGVGIPAEFLRLAWLEFRHRYTQPEAKRYRDWRAVFRRAVRGNWLKVWFLDPASNQYGLTTVGLQAQRAHQERRQA
jgi:uncharacterized protein YdaU (DUF1376 family)